MTNLIPPDAKRGIKKEYWLRVISVWLLLISLCVFVVATLFSPAYVFYDSQVKALMLEEATHEKDASEDYTSAVTDIVRANNIAAQLDKDQEVVSATVLLDAVEAVQSAAIELNTFSYERTGGEVKSITIQGTADSRTALADFAAALKRSPYFTEANVPVSSLIKDVDLPFSIVVSVASQKKP